MTSLFYQNIGRLWIWQDEVNLVYEEICDFIDMIELLEYNLHDANLGLTSVAVAQYRMNTGRNLVSSKIDEKVFPVKIFYFLFKVALLTLLTPHSTAWIECEYSTIKVVLEWKISKFSIFKKSTFMTF